MSKDVVIRYPGFEYVGRMAADEKGMVIIDSPAFVELLLGEFKTRSKFESENFARLRVKDFQLDKDGKVIFLNPDIANMLSRPPEIRSDLMSSDKNQSCASIHNMTCAGKNTYCS